MTFKDARQHKEAQFAYIYLNTIPKSLPMWVDVVLTKPFSKLYQQSRSALEFYQHQLKDAIKDTFKLKYAGHNITLVNCSQVFFSDAAWVAPKGLYMNAAFRKKGVQIQLRGIGAQFIARMLGGDGHPTAAGAFITKEKFMEVVYGQ
jgi:oligoribonuclease NrnB/cAMP/cGMP phosphodiesterase (DHH superfamily)